MSWSRIQIRTRPLSLPRYGQFANTEFVHPLAGKELILSSSQRVHSTGSASIRYRA